MRTASTDTNVLNVASQMSIIAAERFHSAGIAAREWRVNDMEERLFEVIERYDEEEIIVAKYMSLDTALLLIYAMIEKYYHEDFFLAIRPMPFNQETAVGE